MNFSFIKSKILNKKALGFVEVLVAVVIVAACAVPIVYMVTSARTDTSKAINYLRAMELANEVIDWAQMSPYGMVDDSIFSGITGPITIDDSGTLKSAEIAVGTPKNPVWETDGLVAGKLQYSEQYNNAFFYREVEIEEISDTFLGEDMLKKLVVTVKWCEGSRPPNPNTSDGRTREVKLSVLLVNDQHLMY
jgi:hypothetical protein